MLSDDRLNHSKEEVNKERQQQENWNRIFQNLAVYHKSDIAEIKDLTVYKINHKAEDSKNCKVNRNAAFSC